MTVKNNYRRSSVYNQVCAVVGEEGESVEERVLDDYGIWGSGA